MRYVIKDSKNLFLSVLVSVIFLLLAYGSSNDSSSSSSSGSSTSPYSNVSVALRECADELKKDTAAGYYDHLSDVQMFKRMEQDQESCMAGYGHSPN